MLHHTLKEARRLDAALPETVLRHIEAAASVRRIRSAFYEGRANERILRTLLRHGLSVRCCDCNGRYGSAERSFFDADPLSLAALPDDLSCVCFCHRASRGGDLYIYEPSGSQLPSAREVEELIRSRLPEPLIFVLIAPGITSLHLPRNYSWRIEADCSVGELITLLDPRSPENRRAGRDVYRALPQLATEVH